MITWIKKMWARLQAPEPECSPITVTYCGHKYEVLEATLRMSDDERYDARELGPEFFERYVRRQLCNQLATELYRRIEVFAYTNTHDPFMRLYTARIKILLDGGKETK
jgi:hypothetical protein